MPSSLFTSLRRDTRVTTAGHWCSWSRASPTLLADERLGKNAYKSRDGTLLVLTAMDHLHRTGRVAGQWLYRWRPEELAVAAAGSLSVVPVRFFLASKRLKVQAVASVAVLTVEALSVDATPLALLHRPAQLTVAAVVGEAASLLPTLVEESVYAAAAPLANASSWTTVRWTFLVDVAEDCAGRRRRGAAGTSRRRCCCYCC